MKILYILIIFITAINTGLSQDRTFFNLLPDIGAVKGQCVFGSIECDSQYIYIVGDEVVSQDSNGRNKKVKPHLTKFDYKGNLIHSNLIFEDDFNKPYVRQNYPLFKRNDSIYYYNMYNWDDTTLQYLKNYIVAINMRSGQIINKIKVEEPFTGVFDFSTLSEMDSHSKDLLYVFRQVNPPPPISRNNYIYKYNNDLQLLSRIHLKNIQRPITIRYITFKKGFYHLIGDEYEVKNNQFTYKGWLIYLKVDTSGNLIRENKLIEPGNVNTNGGFTYTIASDGNDGYYIVTNDWVLTNDIDPWKGIPYVYHVSSALDTVYWRTRFQDSLIMLGQNSSVISCLTIQNDKSGLVTCGSLNTPPFAEPDYGWIFKCSSQGDSLWARMYQPLGWDSTRAWWMSLESIRTTPYNTLVVCGRVSDGRDAMIKGWLLHLDSEGCLIPGCDKIVDNKDIQSSKEKSFSFYPNPIVSSHLYLLSRIGDQSKFTIELFDISGRVLHASQFNPHQGVQYIMELPSELGNGEYLLKIHGKEFEQTEKIIIIR